MRFLTVDKFFGCGQLKTGVLAIGSLHLVGSFYSIGSSFRRWVLLLLDWCNSGICCPRVGTRRVQVPTQVTRCTSGMCCPRVGVAGTGGWAL